MNKTDAVIGFAIGDALGVPDEFKKRNTFRCEYMRASTKRDFHGNLPAGTWSDDTSLMLCILDALKQPDKESMYARWRKNAIAWKYEGAFTFDEGLPFDIGSSCNRGIVAMKTNTKNQYADDPSCAGNGGLMRVLGLIFEDYATDDDILEMIKLFNSCSHNQEVSHISCLLYIKIGRLILLGHTLKDAITSAITEIKDSYKVPQLQRIWSFEIFNTPESNIRSSGYVADTLEAVLWCLCSTSNYQEAVLSAVNLGDDTDTVGALVGGIAGLYYGMSEIPSKWISKLKKFQMLMDMCK